MKTHPDLDLPPVAGRAASMVIRYANYARFKGAVEFFKATLNSPNSTLRDNGADKPAHYSTPIGASEQAELRLVYRKGGPGKKSKAVLYYEVEGDFPSDAASRQALEDALRGLTQVDAIEHDSDTPDASKTTLSAYRAVVTDGGDEGQYGLLVNPPFPRGGHFGGTKLLAVLATLLGLGALLFGGGKLLGRR